MKQIYQAENQAGWTYYIDWRFAWLPTYCQGTLVWLRRVWYTWPEKNGKPIMASDVLSPADMKSLGEDQPMYRTEFPYDPRKD